MEDRESQGETAPGLIWSVGLFYVWDGCFSVWIVDPQYFSSSSL